MCYSLEISIAIYLLSLPIFTFFALSNKLDYKFLGLIYVYIIQMQLLEGLMWYDQKCQGLNQIVSRISYYFILCQPLVIFLATVYINSLRKQPINQILILLMIPYFLYLLYHLKTKFTQDELCTLPYKNQKHWLVWKWNKFKMPIIWFVSLFIPLVISNVFKPSPIVIFTIMYILVTLVLSNTLSPMKFSGGSLWCFSQGALPILLLSNYVLGK